MKFQLANNMPATEHEKDQDIKWYVIVRALTKKGRKRFEKEFQVPVFESLKRNNENIDSSVSYQSSDSGNYKEEHSSTFGLIDKLRDIGVVYDHHGIKYENKFWNNTGIQKMGFIPFFVGLLLTGIFSTLFYFQVIVATNYFAFPIGLGALLGILFTCLMFFMRYHRFSILFTDAGITRNSQLMSWRWQKTFPWKKIRNISVTRSSSVNTGQRRSHYDKVVIYGDSYKDNMTLSPGFRDEQNAEMLSVLINDELGNRGSLS